MNTVAQQIENIRSEWDPRVLILGHHYQRPEVLAHADFRGDSLELSRHAAASTAERIVFCGVRFMAETADILSQETQSVFMPETTAGCPMASMADPGQMNDAWERLSRVSADWTPVVYVNSTAGVKAFCGRHGGSACTSGNAARILSHYLARGRRIFFAPDEHLAVNTLHDLGFSDTETRVYDPSMPDGGLTDADLAQARLVAWKGFCHVHTVFTAEHVARARALHPGARIIVHPEAPKDVVRAADAHGSTAEIIRYVHQAPDGTVIVIGTEYQLVRRLAAEHAGRIRVFALWNSICPNMAKTTPESLLALLTEWPSHARVRVPETDVADARACLERMLKF